MEQPKWVSFLAVVVNGGLSCRNIFRMILLRHAHHWECWRLIRAASLQDFLYRPAVKKDRSQYDDSWPQKCMVIFINPVLLSKKWLLLISNFFPAFCIFFVCWACFIKPPKPPFPNIGFSLQLTKRAAFSEKLPLGTEKFIIPCFKTGSKRPLFYLGTWMETRYYFIFTAAIILLQPLIYILIKRWFGGLTNLSPKDKTSNYLCQLLLPNVLVICHF